jgi:hypothetical protein
MSRRLFSAICGAALLASLSASVALGGEVTGNGKSKQIEDGGKWGTFLHARSECAYSGQEDLQYQDEQGNTLEVFTKGSPAHAQSWGQIPKADRDFLTSIGVNPGIACNPTKAGAHP